MAYYRLYSNKLSHSDRTRNDQGGRTTKPKNKQEPKKENDIVSTAQGIVGKLSKYIGGFIRKGNRMNNSKAYNHDYYMHNKWRWKMKKSGLSGYKDWRRHYALTAHSRQAPGMPCTVNSESGWEAYKKKYKDVLNYRNPFHKYIYKIMQANGKFRYFYTNAKFSKLLADLPQKTHTATIWEDMSAVNVAYSSREVTPKNENTLHRENCGFCTIAYDLRRRGYDVKAIPNDDGISPLTITSLYKQKDGTERDTSYLNTTEIKTSDEYTHDLFSELAKTGNGASGAVSVTWNGGGGHSLAYQVVKGKAYILDCQTNTIYDEDDFSNLLGHDVNWRAYKETSTGNNVGPFYVRLDDMDINDEMNASGVRTGKDDAIEFANFSTNPEINSYREIIRAIDANGSTRSENNQADLKEGEKIVSYEIYQGKDNAHGRQTITKEGLWYGTRYMPPTSEELVGRK